MSALTVLISACGGGNHDAGAPVSVQSPADQSQADQSLALPTSDPEATRGALSPAGAAQAGADARYTQVTASYHVTAQYATMHGAAAGVLNRQGGSQPAVLAPNHAVRAVQSGASYARVDRDDVRDTMTLAEIEFEKSFSMEMHRRHAEHRELEEGPEQIAYQPYVPHSDCMDTNSPECIGNARVASY